MHSLLDNSNRRVGSLRRDACNIKQNWPLFCAWRWRRTSIFSVSATRVSAQYTGVLHDRTGTPWCDAKLKPLQRKHLEARRANRPMQNSLTLENGAVLRMPICKMSSKMSRPDYQTSEPATARYVTKIYSRRLGIERFAQRGQTFGNGGLPILVAFELQRDVAAIVVPAEHFARFADSPSPASTTGRRRDTFWPARTRPPAPSSRACRMGLRENCPCRACISARASRSRGRSSARLPACRPRAPVVLQAERHAAAFGRRQALF